MDFREDLAPSARLFRLIVSNWMSQAVYVTAELRLADLLADGPKTYQELAIETGTHSPTLWRFLRALTTLDLCRELADGSFELSPTGALLRSDHPESLRSLALFAVGINYSVWGRLLDSVKTGESARKLITGKKEFEHVQQDPSIAAIFNQSMVEQTRLVSREIVRAYDFSHARRIVDVGGGYGELLSAILQANPGTHGILFDQPHAAEKARERMAALGLADRCQFVAGSFFESIPGEGDIYLLKSIIHDWNDEQSLQILKIFRQSMPEEGKLLLIERFIPKQLDTSPEHQIIMRSDLMMLIGPGGRERTEFEFRSLLGSSGFRINRIIPVALSFSILEAVPAD